MQPTAFVSPGQTGTPLGGPGCPDHRPDQAQDREAAEADNVRAPTSATTTAHDLSMRGNLRAARIGGKPPDVREVPPQRGRQERSRAACRVSALALAQIRLADLLVRLQRRRVV